MNRLRRFMIGRYGSDQLSMALLILSIIITLAGNLLRMPVISLISYIPLGLCVYRMLSRDINRRRMENYKFAMLMSPVYSWLKKTQKRIMNSKTHKYFKCPNCKATLRVPKGKGKIIITCTRCKTEFIKKT